MTSRNSKLTVGVDSVVIGRVSGNVGDGSVVIGATDDRGNVILNQPMAVGRNAHAGPGSIAIGVNASAGSELASALAQLSRLVEAGGDQSLKLSFNELCVELRRPEKDRSKLARLWNVIKASGSVNGAIGLIGRVSALIKAAAG
jgi:hypothetical protein